MSRKINNVYVRIAQTFRAWERKYPNQPHRLRVAAFDRIADGLLVSHEATEISMKMMQAIGEVAHDQR